MFIKIAFTDIAGRLPSIGRIGEVIKNRRIEVRKGSALSSAKESLGRTNAV